MSHTEHEHPYENIAIKKLPGSEVEITGIIPVEKYLPYKKQVTKNILKNFELPGFRKGNVPEAVFIKEIGELRLLEEVAEEVLKDAYPHLIDEHTLSIIGSPEINITKLAPGNPIEFTIKTAIYPTVVLPDYTKLAQKAHANTPSVTVTEDDVQKTIQNLRKSRIPKDRELTKEEAEKEEHWPPYDDAFVQSLGAFTTVADFETKLREGIKTEKERAEQDKERVALFDTLIADSQLEVPKALVENELRKMLAQFESDVTRMGVPFEQYLEHIGKTEEDLRKEWQSDAEKRSKLEIILHEIASKESIEVPKERLEQEFAHLKEHHADLDETRARMYLLSILEKEAVVQFLDEQK